MRNNVGERLEQLSSLGQKAVAWLIDPDEVSRWDSFSEQVAEAVSWKVDFFFLGGSLLQKDQLEELIGVIRSVTSSIPIVLFPGNNLQVSSKADAILFLSLISGRNPELLIGQHVAIAPMLQNSGLEVLPTGYMLLDGGEKTSAHYISQTIPLPNHKPQLSVATALAGHFLGLRYFYLDAGSGAPEPVNPEIIRAIKSNIPHPLIVGGGINSLEKAKTAWNAGADLVVVGNGVEKNKSLLQTLSQYLETQRILAN